MLSKRQESMLLDFYQSEDEYIPAAFFEQKYKVSLRTVRNDIKEIKQFAKSTDSFTFNSITSKGSYMEVNDSKKFEELLFHNSSELGTKDFSSREDRVKRIIAILFSVRHGISMMHLADRVFVSRSTLQGDLQEVINVLAKYDIKLVNRRDVGLKVQGTELSIRRCIRMEKVDISLLFSALIEPDMGNISPNLSKVGTILVNVLTEHEYRISNVALQNLVVHADIMISRMLKGFYLEDIYSDQFKKEFAVELQIATDVFQEFHRQFGVPINMAEVKRMAVYLEGKSDYQDEAYITQDVDNFVLLSLKELDDKFSVNFADNMQLRISLALHIIPLKTRLKYDMQLENGLLDMIKKSYQVAFDMASMFSYLLQKHYGYKVIEDEVAYFALYFNNALDSFQQKHGTDRILIITTLKRSESLLLKQRIRYWLEDSLATLDVVNEYDTADYALEDYDVICTTEQNKYYENGLALLISPFPTREDCRQIMMAVDGYSSKNAILALFRESLTIVTEPTSKETLIRELCKRVSDIDESAKDLYHEVMLREEMGGTYYGNQVAMPHTMHPIVDKTYVAVSLLKNDLTWDDNGNEARIVLLVVLEKNNPRAFRLWTYLSAFITNQDFVSAILKNLTYENFIKQLSLALDSVDGKLHE